MRITVLQARLCNSQGVPLEVFVKTEDLLLVNFLIYGVPLVGS